ncbi:unnamed protein product [Prorocentrum cordatum]|uniref:J domain-containing protein n=1 Tax=Prorocentrum cordatum TaxID=2364126 RepID=A0ABN9SU72_9DINO|nr:unnamed protein product [Polarella glacialis]
MPMLQYGTDMPFHSAHESHATAFNIIANIEGQQHMQDYITLTLNCWTLSINFNISTDIEGQHLQDYTTLTLNCHQRNNCMRTLNFHLDLSFDMNGTLDSLHHTWVHFGWGRGARTNSSAGCSIAASKRLFRKIDIVKVLHPLQPDLRGRAGAVELHRGQLRLRLIVAYHASDETEFGRFIHDQLLTHQLTAINTHIHVGNTYYGPNKARSRIYYFIGYDNLMEIVKYVKLNWNIHTKLRSLLHVADHVPMIMQISGVNITNHNIRWDFGLLAAGLQTGAHRVSFLNDVYAEIGKHKEYLTRPGVQRAGMGHDTADYQCADPLAERVYQPSRRKLVIDYDVSSTIIQTFVTFAGTLNSQGEISADPNVHPWATQLADDLLCLSSHTIGESFQEATPLRHALPFVSRWNASWAATSAADLDTDHFDGYERHGPQQQHMQHLRGHFEWLLSPLRLLFLHFLMGQAMTAMAPKQRAPWRLPLDSSQGSKGFGTASSAAPGQKATKASRPPGPPPPSQRRSRSPRTPTEEGGAATPETTPTEVDEGDIGEGKKLSLQATHKTRLKYSISTDTYTMSNEQPVITAITQELEGDKHALDPLKKSGAPEDKKRLKEIGSPAPSLALAALEGLHKCDVGGAMPSAIRNCLLRGDPEDIGAEAEISKEDLIDVISFVRLEKCHDHTKTKLVIGAPMWEGRDLINRALEAEGQAVHHRGVAEGRAGWLEEEEPGAEQKFQEIAKAYEVLQDPQKRQMYDQFGEAGVNGMGGGGGPGGMGGMGGMGLEDRPGSHPVREVAWVAWAAWAAWAACAAAREGPKVRRRAPICSARWKWTSCRPASARRRRFGGRRSVRHLRGRRPEEGQHEVAVRAMLRAGRRYPGGADAPGHHAVAVGVPVVPRLRSRPRLLVLQLQRHGDEARDQGGHGEVPARMQHWQPAARARRGRQGAEERPARRPVHLRQGQGLLGFPARSVRHLHRGLHKLLRRHPRHDAGGEDDRRCQRDQGSAGHSAGHPDAAEGPGRAKAWQDRPRRPLRSGTGGGAQKPERRPAGEGQGPARGQLRRPPPQARPRRPPPLVERPPPRGRLRGSFSSSSNLWWWWRTGPSCEWRRGGGALRKMRKPHRRRTPLVPKCLSPEELADFSCQFGAREGSFVLIPVLSPFSGVSR